jgi:hypothetical protein
MRNQPSGAKEKPLFQRQEELAFLRVDTLDHNVFIKLWEV